MWNYYRDELSNPLSSNSESFKYKTSITGNTYDGEDDAYKVGKNEKIMHQKIRDFFWHYYLQNVEVKTREEGYEKIIEVIDYTTGNLFDYEYFSNNYKVFAIDLSKQIELENPDLKQQINSIGKLRGQDNGATVLFITEKSEETVFTKICKQWKNGNAKDCEFSKQF